MLIAKLLAPISSKLSTLAKVEGMFNLGSITSKVPKKQPQENVETKSSMREIKSFSWVGAFLLLIYLFGILYSIPVFLFAFLKTMAKRKTVEVLLVTIGVTGFVYLLFVRILHIEFYPGVFFK